MNLEATIKTIDERTELISEAFAKTIFLLKDMQEENAQLKREVQELREEMSRRPDESRIREIVKNDGVSLDNFKVFTKHFNGTANGLCTLFDETKELVKTESVKTQNASYRSGSSAVFV